MEETDSEEDSDEVEGAEGGGEDDEDDEDEEEEEDDDGGGECCVPGAWSSWGSGPRLPRAHSLGLFPARASLLVTRGFKFLLNFS